MDQESIKNQLALIRRYVVEHSIKGVPPRFDLAELESIIDTYVLMEWKLNGSYPKKGIADIKAFIKDFHGLEIKEFEREAMWKIKR